MATTDWSALTISGFKTGFKELFKQYYGKDLEVELRSLDDSGRKVDRFVDMLLADCDYLLMANYDNGATAIADQFDSSYSAFRKQAYCEGMLAQANYMLDQGDFSELVDMNGGIVSDLSRFAISPNARNRWRLGGFMNVRRG